MSLINDALKRAKTAQQQAQAPSGPQLRPVEPNQSTRHGVGLALPVTCVVVALLGLFLLWRVASNHGRENQTSTPGSEEITVAARTPAPKQSPEMVKPSPPSPTPAAPAPAAHTMSSSASTTTAAVAVADAGASSNAVSVADAPAKPAPLKLQAIVYNPTRPSATISGRTLFVGDRIGDFRVLAIGQDSVTLVGGGHTNLLNLFD